MQRIVFIGRAPRYSPHCEEKDAAILAAVRSRLEQDGFSCEDIVNEEQLTVLPQGDAFVSMGRSDRCVAYLLAQRQVPVVNSADSVILATARRSMMKLLEREGIPVPPHRGNDGYWVKRGYGTAESETDVVYVPTMQGVEDAVRTMRQRGLRPEVRAHVVGDLVKCYAVRGTDFFRYYYPGDDGEWKFGSEEHNGKPQHTPFDLAALQAMLDRAAGIVGLEVYGGDCIIQSDGMPVLVDLNDWPSFSRCRDEEAAAIAERIKQRLEHAQYINRYTRVHF